MTKKNTLKENYIYQGDSLEVLKTLPDESVNMVMTSPPYWALRDYGVKGQLGLEPTFEEHINKMCDVFDEVKRVLRKDGTCWVNYGDTYSGSMGVGYKETIENTNRKVGGGENKSLRKETGRVDTLPVKSLTMIPFRFAIEMVNRGWILRNTIIWHKPNPMPSSAKDRFTVDFEYLFFFSKSKKYYFEQQFEKYAPASDVRYRQKLRAGKTYNSKEPYKENLPYHSIKRRSDDKDGLCVGGTNPKGRNKRTVWKIPTQPFPEAHFAMFPEKLCVTPIKAGCPPKGIVLDPFMGAGTTALVAKKLGRNYVGIELSKEYIKIAEKRLIQQTLL